jgi:serine/threonine-protein kinase RsbT
VLAARHRVEGDTLAPYAAVTARNLVAAVARRNDTARGKSHLLVQTAADQDGAEDPEQSLLRREEGSIVAAALARLPDGERDLLLAHEVHDHDTRTLAERRSSTPGAVAAQLSRVRAKLRVEYLLVEEEVEPPTDVCRPVLRALSAGDRRRQRELGAGAHLLQCDPCARIGARLLDRRPNGTGHDEGRVSIVRDADVVVARQRGRDAAAEAGFSLTDRTLIATAISEVARNIVRFANRGDMVITTVEDGGHRGVSIVARDSGPGIADVAEAMRDGYSTDEGLGLGLPGARRLMDEFHVVSEVGEGTTVTMVKWRSAEPPDPDTRARR